MQVHTILTPDNKYAYIILQHDSGDSNKNDNLLALNCGIIKVTLSDNSLSCVESGIVPIKRDTTYQNFTSVNLEPPKRVKKLNVLRS